MTKDSASDTGVELGDDVSVGFGVAVEIVGAVKGGSEVGDIGDSVGGMSGVPVGMTIAAVQLEQNIYMTVHVKLDKKYFFIFPNFGLISQSP